jgi:hypothetical protein
MLFRTLAVAPGCTNISENEKTSGNRYEIEKSVWLGVPIKVDERIEFRASRQ